MQRLLLLFFFSILAFPIMAQNNFVATGADISNANGSVNNSIGQLVYKPVNNTSGLIIEGLQQPYEMAGPLPVTLLYFTASVNEENSVTLKWTTTSESNSKDFQVERSIDGINFQLVASVLAAGNSNTNQNYTAIDGNPPIGIIYYRLKQTDLDEKYKYSQIERVVFEANSGSISAGPNPAIDHVMLYMQYDAELKTTYQIASLDGKVVAQERVKANATRINMSNLPNGTYILKLVQDNKPLKTFKVIKQ